MPPIASDRYVPVSLDAGAPVAITDVWVTADTQPAIRPAKGFFLPERDADARVFRWIAGDAHATAYMPHDTARLTIEGWMPVEYFDGPVTLSLAWNGRPVASVRVQSGHFRRQLRVARSGADPWNELTISSFRSFVPDDLTRNGDRRALSLRIYELRLD